MMNELMGKIEAYVDGKISRQEFELWFYELSFDVEKKQPEEIVALVHEVEGLLAEASSAGWSEESLWGELRAVKASRSARLLVPELGMVALSR